jgi:4-hydroxyacetophenone monooxygenase
MISEALKTATEKVLVDVVDYADPATLLGLLYHATGDESLAKMGMVDVPAGFADMRVVADPADIALLRARAVRLLSEYQHGREPPPNVSTDRLYRAMTIAAGEDIPHDERALYCEQLALNPRPRGWDSGPRRRLLGSFDVVVIGAGLAGINAAIQLKTSGISFTVLDKNGGVGGTWFHNRYPGARVDWPSRLYSHTFGVHYPFRHLFAPRAENEAYVNWCADEYGIRSHIQLDTTVLSLRWNSDDSLWYIRTRNANGAEETHVARAIISAIGLLERPYIPVIRGSEEFRGPIFHSSRFDPSLDLSNKRVALVGTGASGMQMAPDLAALAKHLTIFQRSPGWLIPVPGYRDPLPDQILWLNANMPYYSNWARFVLAWNLGDHKLYRIFDVDPDWREPGSVNADNARMRRLLVAHIEKKLSDRPDLAAACLPGYPVFGSRPVLDNGWFDALKRDNVRLVAQGVAGLSREGVITNSGELIPADVVVLATGFMPNQLFASIPIEGREGSTIQDIWAADGPRAYWGTSVPRIPNFFMLYGPNTNPRNLGPVQYGEWTMDYILQAFRAMMENGWKAVEVRQDAYDAFNLELDSRLRTLVSVDPRTRHQSYYTNERGRSAVQSPWPSARVHQALSRFDAENYMVTPISASVKSVACEGKASC